MFSKASLTGLRDDIVGVGFISLDDIPERGIGWESFAVVPDKTNGDFEVPNSRERFLDEDDTGNELDSRLFGEWGERIDGGSTRND